MNFKKITALALAAVLAVSAAGCSGGKDKSWAAKLGDETISAGIYVMNVMDALGTASIKANGTEDFLAADIEGKTGTQFVKDTALESTKRQLAIHQKFIELGLTITDAEKLEYEQYAKEMYSYDADMYKANGVSEQSVIDYNRYYLEMYKVFQAIYGPGGEKAATAEEMNASFAEQYYLAYVLDYPKFDMTTGLPLEGDALTQFTATVEATRKSIEDGANLPDLLHSTMLERGGTMERGADEDYMMPVSKQGMDGLPPFVAEYLSTAAVDSLGIAEDPTYSVIIKKLDETKPPQKMAESIYLNSVFQNKQEEYMAMALEWATAASIEINQPALDHFTGEKIKKETDAYLAAQSSSAAAAVPSSLPADAGTPGNEPAPEAPATESSTPESAAPESSTPGSSASAAG